MPTPLTPSERAVVFALSAFQGAVFAWAAVTLPWRQPTLFSVVCAGAALTHLGCAVSMAWQPKQALVAWRVSALSSLLLLLVATWTIVTGSSFLVGLYGGLGQGLSVALFAVWGQLAFLTLPTACWGLARTRGAPPRLKWVKRGGLAIALLFVSTSLWFASSAHAQRISARWSSDELGRLAALSSSTSTKRTPAKRNEAETPPAKLDNLKPVECREALRRGTHSAILNYVPKGASRRSRNICLQNRDRALLVEDIEAFVAQNVAVLPLKVDLVTTRDPEGIVPSWVDAFKLRPGLDGVCVDTTCLMPWQLLARGEFLVHRPLDFVRDLRFGTSDKALLRVLDAKPRDVLVRIQTHSVVIDATGRLHELRRMRLSGPVLSKDALVAGAAAAEQYLLNAQKKNGKFKYLFHPFTGKESDDELSLPRQAGSTMALCEHGKDSRVPDAVRVSLRYMARYERKLPKEEFSVLANDRKQRKVHLGASALPLIAFVECRDRVGDEFDRTIARLARFVLSMQRPDGGFHSIYRLGEGDRRGKPVAKGHERLYVAGQAILALVTLENLLAKEAQSMGAPVRLEGISREELRDAVERAMSFIADDYWSSSLYPFFFIEENWHCLAAHKALEVHPHERYQRFCLDYVRFRSRLILDERSGVDDEFIGGLGFGNVIPPHNTGAAGLAEALGSAIMVKRALGESTTEEEATLARVLEFCLRQQWMPHNGFACHPRAMGSLSEHTHSPIVRVDFVQHLYSGLESGGAALGLL